MSWPRATRGHAYQPRAMDDRRRILDRRSAFALLADHVLRHQAKERGRKASAAESAGRSLTVFTQGRHGPARRWRCQSCGSVPTTMVPFPGAQAAWMKPSAMWARAAAQQQWAGLGQQTMGRPAPVGGLRPQCPGELTGVCQSRLRAIAVRRGWSALSPRDPGNSRRRASGSRPMA